MNQRTVYPYEVYNRPGSATYADGSVFVDLQPTLTIIQYPRSWDYDSCVRWAAANQFPVPEYFGGTPAGCLTVAPLDPWKGNILGIPRVDH
jgi:hypothetical protein